MEFQDLAEYLNKCIKAKFQADDFVLEYNYYSLSTKDIFQNGEKNCSSPNGEKNWSVTISGDITHRMDILRNWFTETEIRDRCHTRYNHLGDLRRIIYDIAEKEDSIPTVNIIIYNQDLANLKIEINYCEVNWISQIEIYDIDSEFIELINNDYSLSSKETFHSDLDVIIIHDSFKGELSSDRANLMMFYPADSQNRGFTDECCLVLSNPTSALEPILLYDNYELSLLAENSDTYIILCKQLIERRFIEQFIPKGKELLDKSLEFGIPLAMAVIYTELTKNHQ